MTEKSKEKIEVKMKIKNFKNINVFVFGGSSGIGFETALALFARGSNVVIFARNKEKLKNAIELINLERKSDSQKIEYVSVDVSDNKAVKNAVDDAVKKIGKPQLLINCAGRAYPKKFEDISFEQFDETMKINLYGIWNTVSAVFPYMKEEGGYIVNTSSISGFLGVFGYTDYTASKFAIMGFSESLRDEFQFHNISVSVLCPPDTETPGFKTENKTKPVETAALSQNAKLLQAEDVAKALIKGIQKGKKIIIPGFDGKMTYLLKRLFPWLVRMIINSSIKKARKI